MRPRAPGRPKRRGPALQPGPKARKARCVPLFPPQPWALVHGPAGRGQALAPETASPLWAKVNPSSPPEERKIALINTVPAISCHSLWIKKN